MSQEPPPAFDRQPTPPDLATPTPPVVLTMERNGDGHQLQKAGHEVVNASQVHFDAGATVLAVGVPWVRGDLRPTGRANNRRCGLNAGTVAGVIAATGSGRQRPLATHTPADAIVTPHIGMNLND